MKRKNAIDPQLTTELRKQKTAAQVFHSCPRCKNPEPLVLDDEVMCGRCNWNSIEASVNAGLHDELLSLDLDALMASEDEHQDKDPEDEQTVVDAESEQAA